MTSHKGKGKGRGRKLGTKKSIKGSCCTDK